MKNNIKISQYNYPLPDEKVAKFPLPKREMSKLMYYKGDSRQSEVVDTQEEVGTATNSKKNMEIDTEMELVNDMGQSHSKFEFWQEQLNSTTCKGSIGETTFKNIGQLLPEGSMLVFNNTKVIRARLIFHKQSGARIEIFCLEPHIPADHEHAFSAHDSSQWLCIVGNLKKWKEEPLHIDFEIGGQPYRLYATKIESKDKEQVVGFSWNAPLSFGELLESLGRIPIPPYLCRESEESDNSRYQTVYSKLEGSVAAPTAGLHFTPEIIAELQSKGHPTAEVTLHVGAGTFLPVKSDSVTDHHMHIEHFEITLDAILQIIQNIDRITAVGTTSVRTLESLSALGYRVISIGNPNLCKPISQWEIYDIPSDVSGTELLSALAKYMNKNDLSKIMAATQIMIMPGYKFRIVSSIITNFHQPQSTLLLLVSAFIGEDWRHLYDYALNHNFRFLSYGDSSLLIR